MAGKIKYITTGKLAANIGVTPIVIRSAVDSGRIRPENIELTRGKQFRFHPDLAELDFITRLDVRNLNAPRRKAYADRARAIREQYPEYENEGAEDDINDAPDLEEADLKTLKITELNRLEQVAKVEKLRIQLAQMRRELLDRATVEAQLYDYGQRVRQRLQAVPKRVIDDLRAALNRTEAEKLLTDAIEDALRELSDSPPKL